MFKNIRSFLLEILETIIISLIFVMVLNVWVAVSELVVGSSMEPSFYGGERIIVEKVSKRFKNFERGEVVVLNPPDSNRDYIKRIIGIPGDVIKILGCNVYIYRNGEQFKLDEPYLFKDTCTEGGTMIKEGRSIKIEDGFYFLLGDNRNRSADSRFFGLVEKNKIVGRVVFRFWPVERVGFLN